jgi:hypothetical protein
VRKEEGWIERVSFVTVAGDDSDLIFIDDDDAVESMNTTNTVKLENGNTAYQIMLLFIFILFYRF